ncbi:MAG: tetraacyldisaccharide 4'-kinase [Candidatus Omnitrophica bacterium]|nr:tetraacyldisaccharide 4'-kinase [Candidatus Omnitrophota bacterium]
MRIKQYLYHCALDKENSVVSKIIKGCLFILSLLYGVIVWLIRNLNLIRRKKFNCVIISIGNITLGGTGKTTLVQEIAHFLTAEGKKVGIISRGFRKPRKVNRNYDSKYLLLGDEPAMLTDNLGKNIPVIVDSNRIRAVKLALEKYKLDTLILDDGFQQWALYKDLEIVCLDASNPFGNRRLLPRGILRQPISTLKKVDVFILTDQSLSFKDNVLVSQLRQLAPQALIIEAEHKPVAWYCVGKPKEQIALDYLRDRQVIAFCGIGNPYSFKRSLFSCGVSIVGWFEFEDHYPYCKQDIEKMYEEIGNKKEILLVTTQKDVVRLPIEVVSQYGMNIFFLAITLELKDGKQKLFNRLLSLYNL